jgi:taurine dioxygenase
MKTLQVKKLTPKFGAEIIGVDLSKPVPEELFREIEDVFNNSGVVVFRGQNITEDQHVEFSKRFGDLEIHVRKDALMKNRPEIFVVSNVMENGKPVGSIDAGQFWHTDLSYKQVPSRGSLLLAREVPVRDGKSLGDTMFCGTIPAFDGLNAALQVRLEGLNAVHHYEKGYNRDRPSGKRVPLTDEQRKALPDVVHPVVRKHPYTGKKCLFVNEGYTAEIIGLPKSESDSILNQLFEHCLKDEFIYRHNWQVGDLVMWDNCSTQHKAVGDYEPAMRRRMDRTTLKGTAVA